MKKITLLLSVSFLLGIKSINAQNPTLYGMTQYGGGGDGNIFKVYPNPLSYTNLVSLSGTNGWQPRYGKMIQATDGNFYGMTYSGGSNSLGNIFKFNPVTNIYTDIVDFTGTTGSYLGKFPLGSLIQASDGNLYGMTGEGGRGFGNIFKYAISTGTFTNLVNFTGTSGSYVGNDPHGDLVQANDGNLYGITAQGGINSKGNIFKYNPVTTVYNDLVDFTGTTGAYVGYYPDGNLIQASDGNLYGLSTSGGAAGDGNIFEYNLTTSIYSDLIEFTGTTGSYPGYGPAGSLIQASDGNIYGMTPGGGANSDGTMFKYNITTSTYNHLFDFTGLTGSYIGYNPGGSLTQASDGNLYGTTSEQYFGGNGNIFQYNPSTGIYVDMVDFSGTSGSYNGQQPEGELMEYFFTTITVTSNVSCNGGNDGNASATVSGGKSPYTYSWSNGATTSSVSNLSAGTYSVTVNDNKGLSSTASASITQPLPIIITFSNVMNVKCNGENTGSANAVPSNGVAPYTYAWTPSGGTTSTASNLSAGTYTVTVNDSNNCSSTSSIVITQPTTLTGIVSSTPASCRSSSDGSVTCNPRVGTAPYTYSWSTGTTTNIIGTTKTVSGLSGGTYSITVTDANGCSSTNSVVVGQPLPFTAIGKILENVACAGSKSGATQIIAGGGKGPYTYSWSNGSGLYSMGNLSAGTYTCTATDKCGNIATISVTITQPATALTQITSQTNVSCNGNADGTANTSVSGGVPPYIYLWLNGATTSSVTGLSAGAYNVKVTDANTCSITKAFVITQPAAITPVILTQRCVAVNTGTVELNTTGGTRPYTYGWSNGSTNQDLSGLSNGSYTVTVTDNNHCTGTLLVTVSCTSGPDMGDAPKAGTKDCCPVNEISVYPNPNNGRFTIQWSEVSSQSQRDPFGWSVEVYNVLGEKIYSNYSLSTNHYPLDLSNQPNGIYLIRILNADGTLVDSKKVVKTN